MADSIVLRIQHSRGQFKLDNLNSKTTLQELKLKISEETKIPQNIIKLLHGYPPRQVDDTVGSATLPALNLRTGDTLKVVSDAGTGSDLKTAKDTLEQNLHSYAVNPEIGPSLARRNVPANHSCLFTSIDFLMQNGTGINLKAAMPMRELVANIVESNPEHYNYAFLGKSNSDYCSWITNGENWGGAIELSIIAEYYMIEIAVIDCQTARIDRYCEDKRFSRRIFLIYDGTHYDPIVLESSKGTILKTIFSTSDDDEGVLLLSEAIQLAIAAKNSGSYFNTESGSYKCSVCKTTVSGIAGMMQHQLETKHEGYDQL